MLLYTLVLLLVVANGAYISMDNSFVAVPDDISGMKSVCFAGDGNRNTSNNIALTVTGNNMIIFFQPDTMEIIKTIKMDQDMTLALCMHHPNDADSIYLIGTKYEVIQVNTWHLTLGSIVDLSSYFDINDGYIPGDYCYGQNLDNGTLVIGILTPNMVQFFSIPALVHVEMFPIPMTRDGHQAVPISAVTIKQVFYFGLQTGEVYQEQSDQSELSILPSRLGVISGVFPWQEKNNKNNKKNVYDPSPYDTELTRLSVVGSDGIGLIDIPSFQYIARNISEEAKGMTLGSCQGENVLFVVHHDQWEAWDFNTMTKIAILDNVKVMADVPHGCFYNYYDEFAYLVFASAADGDSVVVRAKLIL